MHFGKRLLSYSHEDSSDATPPITLKFKDGSTAHCDLLIGADGVYSTARHSLLELAARDLEAGSTDEGKKTANVLREKKEPVWSGHTAYRATANSEMLRKLNPNHRTLSSFQFVSISFNRLSPLLTVVL